MNTSYWCELAWLGGDTVAAGVAIDVEGDHITAVHPGIIEPPSTATRLAGITLPGLANAHSHAFHRLLRGATQIGVGSFWTWREQMYAMAERMTPETYQRLATAVFGEMALAGITCVGEFHYLTGPDASVDVETRWGSAERRSAARVRITVLDTSTCRAHRRRLNRSTPFGDGDVWVGDPRVGPRRADVSERCVGPRST